MFRFRFAWRPGLAILHCRCSGLVTGTPGELAGRMFPSRRNEKLAAVLGRQPSQYVYNSGMGALRVPCPTGMRGDPKAREGQTGAKN